MREDEAEKMDDNRSHSVLQTPKLMVLLEAGRSFKRRAGG